jgi:hypothetical protein
MGSKYYRDRQGAEAKLNQGKLELESKLSDLYEDYLDAESLADRERISAEIHNTEVKMLQFERSRCAVQNPGGYKEISLTSLITNQ